MTAVARLLEPPQAQPLPVLHLPAPSVGPVGRNRRFMPRLNSHFLVRTHNDGLTYDGVDISFGGMMCVGLDLTWPGNFLDLDLILPGEPKPIKLMGRVVELVSYRGQVAMRIRFDAIAAPARKRIALWMARRASP